MSDAKRKLKIAMACGGTGGHIFPGLATAKELEARGHTITLWLRGTEAEVDAVSGTTWEQVHVPSRGLEGGLKSFILCGLYSVSAIRRSFKIMKKHPPDVVVSNGCNAGTGPVVAAFFLRIPVVLHEANSVPGRMISWLARGATRVGATFEVTRHELKNKARLHITGLPLRAELLEAATARVHEPLEGRPFRILAFGGSQGARTLNRIVRRAVRALYAREPNIHITHLTGEKDEQAVRECYEKAGVPHTVAAFESDMSRVYAQADLAICRAGASTCAELSVFGLPALLVPYPTAAKDHQTVNAEEFFRHKAADVIEEAELEVDWLTDYIEGCIHTPDRLERMRQNMLTWARPDATEQVANLVEEVAAER
jgi:UDP-N-acetylglucosamine--N-acetylmuramyl-(pentapeptide) pyrophosphoryl-undecaprenol N-acetylglucosamine transferase